MEFKTFHNLNNDIINNLHKIPKGIDLVVGVPRSGLLVAELISLYINKPLSSIDVFLDKKIIKSGNTKNKKGFIDSFDDLKKVLIVEDSIDTGNSIVEVKNQLKEFSKNIEFTYLVAYTRTETKNMTDIYFEIIDDDRMFEWNYLHNRQLERVCFDIDGVLCIDPSKDICDDESKYIDFVKNAPVKLVTTRKIGYIVTSRLEKYRKETEDWLKNNNIEFGELFMFQGSIEDRKVPGAHAKHKANIYKRIKSDLFIESDSEQAFIINNETKKGVFCIDNQTYYNGSVATRNINIKKKRFKYKIKKILKNVLGEKIYTKIKMIIKGK